MDLLIDLIQQPWVMIPAIILAVMVAPLAFAVGFTWILDRIPTTDEIKWKIQHRND